MVFVVGVDKVLDFGHLEFADSEEAFGGGDFVSEGVADLGAAEGHLAVVEGGETGMEGVVR